MAGALEEGRPNAKLQGVGTSSSSESSDVRRPGCPPPDIPDDIQESRCSSLRMHNHSQLRQTQQSQELLMPNTE